MLKKTVTLPYEDPVTFGMNAAKPIVDALSDEDCGRIEMIIACTESAFRFREVIWIRLLRSFSAVS
ncbi:hypothetical protein [Pendulispora rubella]|uniref:hypothetical protein n=1 Tax=Pendulispora rubella TaxID=2741070 RepID=UPI00374DFD3A